MQLIFFVNYCHAVLTADISKDIHLFAFAFFNPPFFFFALFSLKPLAHLHPKSSLPHFPPLPPNRRQYTVCHLYRCKSQHSHQWYVSQSVPPAPPLCPQRMSGPPLHIVHFYGNICSVSQCLGPVYDDDCLPFLFFPFCVVLRSFDLVSRLAVPKPLLHPLCLCFLFSSQANSRMEQWKTIRTKVTAQTACLRPTGRRRLQCF